MSPRRPYVIAFLVLLSSVAAIANRPAAAHHAIDLYRSERFDYYFFYDASTWGIVEQESGPDDEYVRFSDGDVWASYWAFEAPGMTPRECVETILDEFDADPSILAYEALTNEGGPARIHGDESSASVDLVMTVAGSDGEFKLATSETCQRVEPGQSFLYTSVNVPAALFNEGRDLDAPWMVGYSPAFDARRQVASTPVTDANGDLLGTLTGRIICANPDAHPEPMKFIGGVFGIARGFSGEFAVDPAAFFGVTNRDETVPVFVEWLYPAAPLGSTLALGPDELGLFTMHVDLKAADAILADLYYLSPVAAPIHLGQVGGCGAGAAAPIIIDME